MEHNFYNDLTFEPGDSTADDEFGAVDIVAAFTALRHDLKLQVRNGAEMQQSLHHRLDLLEQLAQQAVIVPGEVPDNEARRLALALVEIEDALQRAVANFQHPALTLGSNGLTLAGRLKQAIASAGWWARLTTNSLLDQLGKLADDWVQVQQADTEKISLACQGLELLLERVQRLMRERQIERRDVTGLAFDSGLMNALEAVASQSVPPGHVIEQLKPAYLWRKQVLCFAEVRVASTHGQQPSHRIKENDS